VAALAAGRYPDDAGSPDGRFPWINLREMGAEADDTAAAMRAVRIHGSDKRAA
jgi:hypothetical protein